MYNNLFDAFVKTYAEDVHRDGSTVESQTGFAAKKKRPSISERVKDSMTRLRRFYTGMSIYGGTYVTFIAIEFSLYETCLREIEQRCEGVSLLHHTLDHLR